MVAAVSPSTVHDAADEVADRYRFQTELPGDPEPEPDEDEAQRDRDPRSLPNWAPPAAATAQTAGAIGQVLMWVALVVVVLLIVFMLIQSVAQRAPPNETAAEVSALDLDEDGEATPQPLGDADALARAGRFAEAIHVLLIRAIRSMAQRGQWDVPSASTSREVLAKAPVKGRLRDALRFLVEAVELTRWGERPADQAAYERCRNAYQSLTGPSEEVA